MAEAGARPATEMGDELPASTFEIADGLQVTRIGRPTRLELLRHLYLGPVQIGIRATLGATYLGPTLVIF
jgi:hypothetical protein